MIWVVISLAPSLKFAWDWLCPTVITIFPKICIHTFLCLLVLRSTPFPCPFNPRGAMLVINCDFLTLPTPLRIVLVGVCHALLVGPWLIQSPLGCAGKLQSHSTGGVWLGLPQCH